MSVSLSVTRLRPAKTHRDPVGRLLRPKEYCVIDSVGKERGFNTMGPSSNTLASCLCDVAGVDDAFVQPEYLNVCFWYVPTRMRHLAAGPQWDAEIETVIPVFDSTCCSTILTET